MKVIFIEDVPRVARVGQTRVVADGYARNYLFPRRLAVLADSQAAVAIESELKKKVRQRELEEAEMAELAKKLEGIEITLKAKVGENEKLYGSVTGADIAEALSQAAGCEIDKKKIDLPEPIKQAGGSEVTVRLAHEISAVITVNVVPEEAVAEAPAEAEKPTKKKKAKAPEAPVAEAPVAEAPAGVTPEAVEEKKPPREKKSKASRAAKEEAPMAEAAAPEGPAAEEKKEKKPRARAKKAEAAGEEPKES